MHAAETLLSWHRAAGRRVTAKALRSWRDAGVHLHGDGDQCEQVLRRTADAERVTTKMAAGTSR